MEQAWWLSLIGAALVLDHAMIGQFMICQPLVLGAILGATLGNLPVGLLTGALVQLLWINILPVGAYIPSDHTVTGGITVALTIWLVQSAAVPLPAAMIVALCLAIPAGFIAGKLDIGVRHFNSLLAGQAEQLNERWGLKGIEGITLVALILAYLRNLLVFLLWLGPGAYLAQGICQVMPPAVLRGLGLAFWGLPMLAFAVVLEMSAKGRIFWLILAASLMTCMGVWILPPAALGIYSIMLVTGVILAFRWRTW